MKKFECFVRASVTASFSGEVLAADADQAKLKFAEMIQDGSLAFKDILVEVVEPPVEPHDFLTEDIEVKEL
jgi:hypothetical protein